MYCTLLFFISKDQSTEPDSDDEVSCVQYMYHHSVCT